MKSKNIGLIKKYEVKKLSNPSKEIDAVVLEFDDLLSRKAIRKFAGIVLSHGFWELGHDLKTKCNRYDMELSELSGIEDEISMLESKIKLQDQRIENLLKMAEFYRAIGGSVARETLARDKELTKEK
jgi:hypothetical protein